MSTTRDFGDGLTWRKSRKSSDQGGNCVYTATSGGRVGVRDSKEGIGGPRLWVDQANWTGLLTLVQEQAK